MILNWIKSEEKKKSITAYSDGSKSEVGEGYVEGSLKKQCLPFYIESVSLLSYSLGLRLDIIPMIGHELETARHHWCIGVSKPEFHKEVKWVSH